MIAPAFQVGEESPNSAGQDGS